MHAQADGQAQDLLRVGFVLQRTKAAIRAMILISTAPIVR
jgi:hypothetical protein